VVLKAEDHKALEAVARDLPALWSAPTTRPQERNCRPRMQGNRHHWSREEPVGDRAKSAYCQDSRSGPDARLAHRRQAGW
jgi:hypothetical protein